MTDEKIESGMTIGRWTVENDTRYVKNRKQWLCRCQCGTEKYVDENNLLFGKSKSCGCAAVERGKSRAKNLNGQKFGRLTVLERAANKGRLVCWKCKCSCGNETIVSAKQLLSGKTRSCGCLRKEKTIENHGIRDLRHYQTGYIRVLYQTDRRNKKRSVVWHCICTRCGKEVDLSEDELTQGNYVSCSCYRKELNAHIGETLHFVDNTCVEWLENRKHRSDNKSGFRGVTCVANHKYKVSIGFRKVRYYLGTYDTLDEAIEVRLNAEKQYHDAFVEQFKLWNQGASVDPEWAKENPFEFHPTVKKQIS